MGMEAGLGSPGIWIPMALSSGKGGSVDLKRMGDPPCRSERLLSDHDLGDKAGQLKEAEGL